MTFFLSLIPSGTHALCENHLVDFLAISWLCRLSMQGILHTNQIQVYISNNIDEYHVIEVYMFVLVNMTSCLSPLMAIILFYVAKLSCRYILQRQRMFGKVCEWEKCVHNLPSQKMAFSCYTSESTILI